MFETETFATLNTKANGSKADLNIKLNKHRYIMLSRAFFFYGFYFYFAEQVKRDVVCQQS